MRLANLVAATSLWTEKRSRGVANTGTAALQTDGVTALRELDYAAHIRDIDGDSIHRRFQIFPEGSRRAGSNSRGCWRSSGSRSRRAPS